MVTGQGSHQQAVAKFFEMIYEVVRALAGTGAELKHVTHFLRGQQGINTGRRGGLPPTEAASPDPELSER